MLFPNKSLPKSTFNTTGGYTGPVLCDTGIQQAGIPLIYYGKRNITLNTLKLIFIKILKDKMSHNYVNKNIMTRSPTAFEGECHMYEPVEAGRSGPESAASDPVVVVGPGPVLSGGRSVDQPGSRSGCPDPPAGSTGQGNGQRSCDNAELL